MTRLAAVGLVFPWRFFAPHDALARKKVEMRNFQQKFDVRTFQESGLIWGTYLPAAHVELLFLLIDLIFQFPFFQTSPRQDSEIQLAVRGCHSSLILWPISQWWWCIINISINQALGISTDWMSLQKEGKKMVENKSKNGLSHLLHFPSPRPRSLSQCLNLNPTWKPEKRNRN